MPTPLFHAPHARRKTLLGVLAVIALVAVTLSVIVGRGLQSASSEVAYLRDGQLWTIRSDGSGARMLASGNIVGFAWSPDHHSIVFRSVGKVPVGQTAPNVPDLPSSLQAVSINGGFPLQITPEEAGVIRSDAWWNAGGNRVMYRESQSAAPEVPLYVVSQTDQPAGIARKIVTNAIGMPAVSPDGKQVAVVNAVGDVVIGEPGETGTVVAHKALAVLPTGRPARVEWRPNHASEVLYESGAGESAVDILLASAGGPRRIATVPGLLDAAFSPDGTWLLARTARTFALTKVDGSAGQPAYTWEDADPAALPWWSPDSKTLLIRDSTTLSSVDLARMATKTLADGLPALSPLAGTPSTWTPATSSPWSPDGRSIAFAADTPTRWSGAALEAPTGVITLGLYVADISPDRASAPRRIASGVAVAASWGFADPATVFLVSAGQ